MANTPYIQLPDDQKVVPVSATSQKWTDDFGGNAINSDKWEVETDIGGMTSVVTGSTLAVTMGVNANAELRLLSRETFTIPFDIGVSFLMSQRIANNNVYFELVEVNAAGVPVVNAALAGDWNNRAAILLTGTSTTTWNIEAVGEGASAVAGVTVTSSNSTSSAVDALLEVRPQDILMTNVPANSIGARSGSAGRISTSVPDPNKVYKVRLRFKNASSAPATSTVVTINRVIVMDVQEIAVEIASGRGDSASGKGVPVNMSSGVGLIATNSFGSGTTAHKLLAAATTNATSVKTTSGKLLGGVLKNLSAANKFVKFYSKASAPTVGTDTPIFTIALSANETFQIADFVGPIGHSISTGIAYAITGAVADSDTTAVAAGDVMVNLIYA
ncbi:hypothetical protein [Pararhizobium sp. A13]|uniref:hypothetical protein n=1 Tax=Pararhizobium sp. A13 TaxID=3133975 RepID=UPI003254AF6A